MDQPKLHTSDYNIATPSPKIPAPCALFITPNVRLIPNLVKHLNKGCHCERPQGARQSPKSSGFAIIEEIATSPSAPRNDILFNQILYERITMDSVSRIPYPESRIQNPVSVASCVTSVTYIIRSAKCPTGFTLRLKSSALATPFDEGVI